MTAAGLVVDVSWLTVAGLVLLALSGLLCTFSWRKGRAIPDNEKDAPKGAMGNYNTIIGKVATPPIMGSGNTIVGATDEFGNAIINQPTSIGYKAGYAPDSVIIGAFAGANLPVKREDEKD
jgi:hypothetical protein